MFSVLQITSLSFIKKKQATFQKGQAEIKSSMELWNSGLTGKSLQETFPDYYSNIYKICETWEVLVFWYFILFSQSIEIFRCYHNDQYFIKKNERNCFMQGKKKSKKSTYTHLPALDQSIIPRSLHSANMDIDHKIKSLLFILILTIVCSPSGLLLTTIEI